MTTTDDTPYYTVETDVTQIFEVYWFGSGTVLSDIFGDGFDVLFGFPLFDIESGNYKRALDWLVREQMRARFDWEFNPHEGRIYLIPEPETTGVGVYYVGAKDWTWETVPAGREDVVVRWATAQCLKMLGRARAKLSGVPRSGGTIDYGSLDSFVRDGQYEEAKVIEELMAESKRWMVSI